eukprot:41876_1
MAFPKKAMQFSVFWFLLFYVAEGDKYQTAIDGIADIQRLFSKTLTSAFDLGRGLDYVYNLKAADSATFDIHIHYTPPDAVSPAHIYQSDTSIRINDDEYTLSSAVKALAIAHMQSINLQQLKTKHEQHWSDLRTSELLLEYRDQK